MMSECEGEKEWIVNPREHDGCVGKGMLLSNAGYHLPVLAQLLFFPFVVCFPSWVSRRAVS